MSARFCCLNRRYSWRPMYPFLNISVRKRRSFHSISTSGVSMVIVLWSVSATTIHPSGLVTRTISDKVLSLIHILRCRRIERCRSRWSPYHLKKKNHAVGEGAIGRGSHDRDEGREKGVNVGDGQ